MMLRILLIASVTAFAQTRLDNGLTVLFRDAAARVHTESTLAHSPLSTKGVVSLGDGDVTHRLVFDSSGKVMFAYDISVNPVPNNARAFDVRVKPNNPDYFMPQYIHFEPGDVVRIGSQTYTVRPDGVMAIAGAEIRVEGLTPGQLRPQLRARGVDSRVDVTVVSARREYATIAAAREFLAVRIGEAVSLDILFNPSSGERIYDVIEPVEMPTEPKPPNPADELSFERPRVSVNGTVLQETSDTWMIGTGIQFVLAKYGRVYVSVKPLIDYPFEPVGRVEGMRLTFALGNDLVEVISRSNILKTQENGTVWIYRDRKAPPANGFGMGVGAIEKMLPRR